MGKWLDSLTEYFPEKSNYGEIFVCWFDIPLTIFAVYRFIQLNRSMVNSKKSVFDVSRCFTLLRHSYTKAQYGYRYSKNLNEAVNKMKTSQIPDYAIEGFFRFYFFDQKGYPNYLKIDWQIQYLICLTISFFLWPMTFNLIIEALHLKSSTYDFPISGIILLTFLSLLSFKYFVLVPISIFKYRSNIELYICSLKQ